MISEPGNYEFCWATTTESGEVVKNARNVVVTQHGDHFYFRWANENFVEYPCGHEGMRCDLGDTPACWFVRIEGDVLGADDVIQPCDMWLFPGGEPAPVFAATGLTVGQFRQMADRHGCTVIRPTSMHPFDMKNLTSYDLDAGTYDFEPSTAVNGAAVGTPGLQATG